MKRMIAGFAAIACTAACATSGMVTGRGDVQRAVAEAQQQMARQRLERLEQLLKDGAASQRAVEEAHAQHAVAEAALEAARGRLQVASRNSIGAQGEIVVSAPYAGLLLAVHAAAGQTVAASAPLFEVAQVDALWVRVPDREQGNPRPAPTVVLDASIEVRSAVLYGTMIVMLVFLPVFMLEGLTGAFFRPLALSYVLAILASLGVALTVTPALCLLMLEHRTDKGDARLVRWLKARYRSVLPRFVDRPKTALGALAVLFALTAAVGPLLGEEFLPNFREYDFLMHWVEKPCTSLEGMQRITQRAARELLAVPGVRNQGAHIGRAEVADEVVGPNFTELWISLDPGVDYDATVAKVQSIVDGSQGAGAGLDPAGRSQVQAGAGCRVRPHTGRDPAPGGHPCPGDEGRGVLRNQQLFDVVVWGAPDVRRNLDTIRNLQLSRRPGRRFH